MKIELDNSPYIISFDTFIIKPVFSNKKVSSLIMEKDKEIASVRRPSHIIRKSCYHYGNSFQSVTTSSKRVLRKSHKLPIVIAHDFGQPLVFLPTMSPTASDVEWVALHAIQNVTQSTTGCTVYFSNGKSTDLAVSESTFHRQYTLGTFLKKDHLQRLKHINHWMFASRQNQ